MKRTARTLIVVMFLALLPTSAHAQSPPAHLDWVAGGQVAGAALDRVAAMAAAEAEHERLVAVFVAELERQQQERQAAAEAARQAEAARVQAAAIPVDWARWQRLHECEQPGNWYANGGNAADPGHQTFQGGLGMSTVAWSMGVAAAARRGVQLPGSALAASPEQQMTGAQAFYDAYGWGWACRV